MAQKQLTLNVTSDADVIRFTPASGTSARTIAPEAVDSEYLKFFLGGTNLVTNQAITVQKVTFIGNGTSTTEGTVTVELDATNYRFVLVAIPADKDDSSNLTTLITNAVLIGYASADLRYTEEAASINFVLTSDGLTGNGKLDLSLYLKEWSKHTLSLEQTEGVKVISKADVGLYNIETGEIVSGTLKSPFSFLTAQSEDSPAHYYGTSSNSITNIKSGTYDLTVTFTLSNNKKYIYSEKVIILANRTTEKLVPIPDVIDLPPDAP